MDGCTFRDNTGRDWPIQLNARNVLVVRSRLGFDITKMYKSSEVEKLNDIELLVSVVYLLCKPQADRLNLSADEFAEVMVGDSFNGAVDAMWEAVTLFTPSKNRPTLRLIRDAGAELEAMANKAVAEITPTQLATMALAKSAT